MSARRRRRIHSGRTAAQFLSRSRDSNWSAKLYITDIEILRRHYAETLLHWDRRFQARRAAAEQLFDARFCGMWEFYLVAGEMGFRYGKQRVIQMQLARTNDTLPITRDDLLQSEAALRQRERPRLQRER